MNTQIFQYNGSPVTFQRGNVTMINATQMAKPFNKRPNDYLNLPSTIELIEAITRKSGIAVNQLVSTVRGGVNPGTWMHEDVALDFAQWLSVDFRLWCNDRIKELLKFGITATHQTIDNILADPDNAIKMLTALKEERKKVALLEEQHQHQLEMAQATINLQSEQLKEQAPKVEYTDKVLASTRTYTTTQMAKELNLRTADQLHKMLKAQGIMMQQSGQWLLTAKYSGQGYTKTRTHVYTSADGMQGTNSITVWTERGRWFLHQLIAKKGGNN